MNKSNELLEKYEFKLELDTVKSIGYYRIGDIGQKHIEFDSQVYVARYATVNTILALPQWLDQFKKVF